jgi:predicted small lipoprotein YifL
MKPSPLAALLVIAMLLAACGNKGPLYLPGEPPKDPKKQGPAPERAP